MRNRNHSLSKHIAITSVMLVVTLILLFVYHSQTSLEEPNSLNIMAQKISLGAMIIVIIVGTLANIGLYLFDKYLR